jgi:undecaprenyl-diphosphatase
VRVVIDQLVEHVSRLGHWSYLIFFLGAALECSAFLGLLVPGESLVLVGGFFASLGLVDLKDLIVVVAIGAILGDSVGYELGRHLGRPWLIRYGRRVGIRAAHLDRAERFFARHGGKTVFIGRFIGFLRALAPFAAGSSRMPYRSFLMFNVLGAILWASSFVLLGYFFGQSWQLAERWIGRASAIVGGTLLVLFALIWVWRWASRHEADLKRYWAVAVAHPWVVAVRPRVAPLVTFVEARLSPQGYLGLHLTLGALVLLATGWLFGAIAQDVVKGEPLTVVDAEVAAWLHAHATPGLTAAMLCITNLGAPLVVSGVAVVLALYFTWQRGWYRLLALFVVVPGGMLFNVMLQTVFHRARPQFSDPILTVLGHGFPSGHTMAATVFYGLLAAFAVWTISAWRWRVLVVLVAGFIVLMIGFSRLYLGAHYLSDVLAGIAEGLAWLALGLTAVESLRRKRSETGSGSAAEG